MTVADDEQIVVELPLGWVVRLVRSHGPSEQARVCSKAKCNVFTFDKALCHFCLDCESTVDGQGERCISGRTCRLALETDFRMRRTASAENN